MNDFVYLARIVKDAIHSGAWPMMLIIYGGSLLIGIFGAKVAFALSRTLGFVATGGSLVYLYNLEAASGGIIVPVGYPPAWAAWGVILIASSHVYDHVNNTCGI